MTEAEKAFTKLNDHFYWKGFNDGYLTGAITGSFCGTIALTCILRYLS